MARLIIRVTGIKEAVGSLTKARARFYPALVAAVAERAAELAREEASVDTGELAGSIHVEPGARVVASAPWASFVEHGTRPGYFPNIGNITPWAVRHGIAPGALATAIMLRGTPPHPFMQPAADKVQGEIPIIAEKVWRSLGI